MPEKYLVYYTGIKEEKEVGIYRFKRLVPISMNKSEIKQIEFRHDFSITKSKVVEDGEEKFSRNSKRTRNNRHPRHQQRRFGKTHKSRFAM